jgi:hypothetical protein
MIPKKMSHIWIGPNPMPEKWMQTWKDAHPDWSYNIYDNAYLSGRRFRNQQQINSYFRQSKYAGVADLMRYEILLEEGGFLAEADSICLHPIDELLTEEKAYSVYEYPEGRGGLMSPFLASNPGNRVIGSVIEALSGLDPKSMGSPWRFTGNGFLSRFFRANPELQSEVKVFPSHYFLPEHHSGEVYAGSDRIYSRHMWGTTKSSYADGRLKPPLSSEQSDLVKRRILRQLKKNRESTKT